LGTLKQHLANKTVTAYEPVRRDRVAERGQMSSIPGYDQARKQDTLTATQIEYLIDTKIREHEIRVAVISGLLGFAVLAGMFHAIWLNSVS
jgi:hypothetical protein